MTEKTAMDIDPDGVARYHQFAENYRQQCREKRLREAEWQRELNELDELAKSRTPKSVTTKATIETATPSAAQSEGVRKTDRANAAGLVFKTHDNARVTEVDRANDSVLDADGDAGFLAQFTANARAYATANTPAANPYPWWSWFDRNLEYRHRVMRDVLGHLVSDLRREWRKHCAGEISVVKRELEQQRRELGLSLREQVLECGRALREEAKAAHEQQEQRDSVIHYEMGVTRRELAVLKQEAALEREFKTREIEQLHDAVDMRAELQRGMNELGDQVASAQAAQAQGREDLLQREVAALREQVGREQEFKGREIEQLGDAVDMRVELQLGIKELRDRDASVQELLQREVAALCEQVGLQRELEDLRKQVAVVKSEIPSVPAVVEQLHGEHAELKREQTQLERELAKQKDRLGKLRVDQSVTDHSLKKLESVQQPVVELKFVTEDGCCFSLKDAHPDAIETWRRFAHELVAANDGVMFPSDPNNVISMPAPARKVGAA
jgi:hypothetical protein